MSNDTQRAAVALRNIIVGGVTVGDRLADVNTALIPEGALAYVVSTESAYRLDKSSSTAVPTAVVPDAGPGRWLLQPGSSSNGRAGAVTGTAVLASNGSFAVVQNTWIALVASAGFYASGASSAVFGINTTTGIVTYSGPPGQPVEICASATISSATAAEVVDLAISVNGALIGAPTFVGSAGAVTVDTTSAGLGAHVSTSVLAVLSPGDTVQSVVRNESGSHNLNVTHYNLVITPVS